MKNIIWRLIHIITLTVSALFVAFGIYEQITGPAKAEEELLKKLRIPLSYNQVLIIGLICVFFSVLLHYLRNKI